MDETRPLASAETINPAVVRLLWAADPVVAFDQILEACGAARLAHTLLEAGVVPMQPSGAVDTSQILKLLSAGDPTAGIRRFGTFSASLRAFQKN